MDIWIINEMWNNENWMNTVKFNFVYSNWGKKESQKKGERK